MTHTTHVYAVDAQDREWIIEVALTSGHRSRSWYEPDDPGEERVESATCEDTGEEFHGSRTEDVLADAGVDLVEVFQNAREGGW